MIFQTPRGPIRCLISVRLPNRSYTTRDPTDAEERTILAHLQSPTGPHMLGTFAVPGVGDVTFLVHREPTLAPERDEEVSPADDVPPQLS